MSRLASRIVRTADGPPDASSRLYVLHGFFGSGRNWASFARRLVELRPDWTVALVDQRLHGESPDLAGPHTVAAAAEDVLELISAADFDDQQNVALLGHSFGGKVALEATGRSSPPPVQTWLIDSTPAVVRGGGTTERMLARLEDSPSSFVDRDAGVSWIMDGGFDEPMARWMATNLERRGDTWAWGMDTEGLRELLEDFGRTDLWSVLEEPPTGADIHVVRASASSLLASEHLARLEALSARGEPVILHELEGGHWLHVDNPDGLLQLVAARLPRGTARGSSRKS